MKYMVILCIILTSTVCFTVAGKPNKCGPIVREHNCDCKAKTSGMLKRDGGKLLMCDGDEYKALQFEYPLGSHSNPGDSCEDIMNGGQSANGIYFITLTDSSEAFPVYCDMDAGGWTMVYKAVSGVNENAYDIYNSDYTHNEKKRAALDVTNQYFADYKNRIVLNWDDFNPAAARVVLYEGGNVVKELNFNAQGSDKLNWFQNNTLIDTPWDDIRSEEQNFFTLDSTDINTRREFFISRNYHGCPGDAGWMVITGFFCDWEKHYGANTILYSKLSTYTNWNDYENLDVADVLVVYLR